MPEFCGVSPACSLARPPVFAALSSICPNCRRTGSWLQPWRSRGGQRRRSSSGRQHSTSSRPRCRLVHKPTSCRPHQAVVVAATCNSCGGSSSSRLLLVTVGVLVMVGMLWMKTQMLWTAQVVRGLALRRGWQEAAGAVARGAAAAGAGGSGARGGEAPAPTAAAAPTARSGSSLARAGLKGWGRALTRRRGPPRRQSSSGRRQRCSSAWRTCLLSLTRLAPVRTRVC